MNKESGLALAEVLVALMILSMVAVVLANATRSALQTWTRSEQRIERVRDLVQLPDKAFAIEAERSDSSGATIELDENTAIVIASGKIDEPADCVFDLVGRRCR